MRGDRSLAFAVFALADRLHKTVAEIEGMSVDEFNGWQAYSIVAEEKRKERA